MGTTLQGQVPMADSALSELRELGFGRQGGLQGPWVKLLCLSGLGFLFSIMGFVTGFLGLLSPTE